MTKTYLVNLVFYIFFFIKMHLNINLLTIIQTPTQINALLFVFERHYKVKSEKSHKNLNIYILYHQENLYAYES